MRSREILEQDCKPATTITGQESPFLVQVIDKRTGEVVQWIPGRRVEKAIVAELCTRVALKGVGVLRTQAHVVADVRAALEELLYDLKSQV